MTLGEGDRHPKPENRKNLARALQRVLDEIEYVDVWRVLRGDTPGFTFQGPGPYHSRSRLDRFYVPKDGVGCIANIRVIPSFSDHKVVFFELILENVKKRNPVWKLPLRLLEVEEFAEAIKGVIEYFTECLRDPEADVKVVWENFKCEVRATSFRFLNVLKNNAPTCSR